MERLLIVVAVVVVAIAIALWQERRRRPDAPAQGHLWHVPSQLDRDDFARSTAPWLVAVFTSRTCDSCAGTVAKAAVLECADVAVDEVPVQDRPEVHRRYAIDAVPITVVADAEGVVRARFVGPPTATDLWAAVAEVRAPGSVSDPNLDLEA